MQTDVNKQFISSLHIVRLVEIKSCFEDLISMLSFRALGLPSCKHEA